jgi:ribosomal protein S18 acetylase RimI-like enzyme
MLRIFAAETDEHIKIFHQLFKEYEKYLDIDLRFQDFETELANLPGVYTPPEGCMLLAEYDNKIAGCVALKKIGEGICEMKRLYVRPEFRGKAIGRKLSEAIIEEARKIGYKKMRLDSLKRLNQAISLYQSMGFKEIKPYVFNPLDDVVYMEVVL